MKLFQLYPKALAHLTCKSPKAAPKNGKRNVQTRSTKPSTAISQVLRRNTCVFVENFLSA